MSETDQGATLSNEPSLTLESGGACTNAACRSRLPPIINSAPAFFENGFWVCQKCGEKVDLWLAVSEWARRTPLGTWALTSIGAGHTSFHKTMTTGNVYTFNLEKYGVPAQSKILDINFTGSAGQDGVLTGLMWHGNTVPRRLVGTVLRVMAVGLGKGAVLRTGVVSVNLVWVRQEESDGWKYLLNAIDAAADQEYASTLVFAQSAVEISIAPIVTAQLRRFASTDSVKSFMRESGTFSGVLNVLLPNICAMNGIPQLPDSIRGALNSLRKKRNLVIHEGVSRASVTAEDAADGLSAAALGFEYARYISTKLPPRQ